MGKDTKAQENTRKSTRSVFIEKFSGKCGRRK